MKKTTISYEAAVEKLRAIISELEEGVMKIDDLTAKLEEAKQLLAFCNAKLEQTENDVTKLLDNEQE